MKRFLLFVLSLLLASPIFAREQCLLARVTVYWASGGGGSDAYTRAHKCATGAHLRPGHCAVDPRKIVYGSKVIFPDATCVAVDTGRDVVNRKAARRCGRNASERGALVIDRFFETKCQALRWANTHPQFMTVRVLSPGEQLAESRNPGLIANQSAPLNAVKLLRITRPDQVALAKDLDLSDLTNPKNTLVAARTRGNGLQYPRRF